MPNFAVVVDHESERPDVVVRLRDFSQQIQSDLPVELTELHEEWDDQGNLAFAFKAMGFKISGTVVTCEQSITVSGQLPFAAVPFRGAIENQLAQSIRQAIFESNR